MLAVKRHAYTTVAAVAVVVMMITIIILTNYSDDNDNGFVRILQLNMTDVDC